MSYSINAKAATKDELKIAIRDKLSDVLKTQPLHETDIDQAYNAAESLIVLMADDADRDTYCSVAGSIWKNEAGVQQLSLNISTSFVKREV